MLKIIGLILIGVVIGYWCFGCMMVDAMTGGHMSGAVEKRLAGDNPTPQDKRRASTLMCIFRVVGTLVFFGGM